MASILLAGGAEFGGRMAEADQRAIELAGGISAPIVIIPAAAAPDNNHARAGANGTRWFRRLGAQRVEVAPIVDRVSANDPIKVATLRTARLIYLLGGFTDYLAQTLRESLAWQAVLDAHAAGAVVAGSSAGAMVLCEFYYDPSRSVVRPGLGFVSNACVLPHHNSFGHRWFDRARNLLPAATILGLDEQTGMINDASDDAWSVYGPGTVTVYVSSTRQVVSAGQSFKF